MKCDNCGKERKILKPIRRFGSKEKLGDICDNCMLLLMEGKPLKGIKTA